MYEKAKQFLTEILEAENDIKQWFSVIIRVPNKNFILNNIENRIGKEINNKELWHLYIKYLNDQKDNKVKY